MIPSVIAPFFLLYGREAILLIDLLYQSTVDSYIEFLMTQLEEARNLARLHTTTAQGYDKEQYNAKHRPTVYQENDLV